MGLIAFGLKAAIKAVIKKILITERGKRIMEWLKEKLNAVLSSKITKIVVYLASLAANAVIAIIGFFMGSGLGLAIAILAIVGAAFALFTLLLKDKLEENNEESADEGDSSAVGSAKSDEAATADETAGE